jgi:hypothetical protein
MYDNPIYRWRASIAVALSEMRERPLGGYVAYRSISDYLNQHGLALLPGEANPLPTPEERNALIYNPDRLEHLFQAAAVVPLDRSLPPVPIVGNEKGEADFYRWAFSLFGINLAALWKFYFMMLLCSCVLFFLEFWQFPFCVLLLLVYLVGHYALVGLASAGWVQTVHNSRFFPVLALLPAMHLLLLLLRRARISWLRLVIAAAQSLLLFFLIFCRFQAMWQPVAIVVIGAIAAPWRLSWASFRRSRVLSQTIAEMVVAVWPAALVVIGAAGLLLYEHVALDRHLYASETRTHTFWEPLFSGTVSADPELCKLYCFGQEPYSDTLGYMAVLDYLRSHNNSSPAIAYVADGQIQINAMKNMGVYDDLLRHLFFDVLRHHPWLVLKSILFDKIISEIDILAHGKIIHFTGYRIPLILAFSAGVLVALSGTPAVRRVHVMTAVRWMPILSLFSLTTTEIIPDIMIFDTLLLVAAIPIFAATKLRLMPESLDGCDDRLCSSRVSEAK